MIQSFRDLQVWQKGMNLVVSVYRMSEKFPQAEMFGLTAQVRRAAVSIPSNVAEGKAVGGQRYRRHVSVALGSEAELETQIELAQRLKMLSATDTEELMKQTSEVGRMLAGLLKALPKKPKRGR